MNPSEI